MAPRLYAIRGGSVFEQLCARAEGGAGELGEAFAQMSAKLRLLAGQAAAIARDDLDSPLLGKEQPGTLGGAATTLTT